MKGDFSRWRYAPYDNFNGILPQQGKVLLDSDGIAQTLIENNWHETAARDWVGRVAGVPASVPHSFKISAASLAGGEVTLTVGTGHLWADGLLVRLESETGNKVKRTATWLEPPLVATEGSAADVAEGTTDAVVLEVWQHAVNGFQMPNTLIEPALGGPDTAERLQTVFAFKLARLAEGQSCAALAYDESGRGSLTASLLPPVTTAGDCPTDGSGGYSGFEHQLYRIEVADVNSSSASQFKWSRTNGGLVGRGTFDPTTQSIQITANLAAITGANQTSFYLEIESYSPDLGFSRVIAAAQATLSGTTLQCTAVPNFGAYPSASGSVFFRLWDGISPVSSFPVSASPVELESGILLQFDPDGPGKYLPGDYWTFPVRAQGISNPQTLIDAKKPQGIVYYRVPLAEINWTSSGNGSFASGMIEDCRAIVQPLSERQGCCTCRVGDGVESFGEFTRIQDAIDSLPDEGGEVCILPGRYYEHVRIINRKDIVIHGCGWQTRVASPSLGPQNDAVKLVNTDINRGTITDTNLSSAGVNDFRAVFTILACQHIQLRSFAVEADEREVGILIDGTGTLFKLAGEGNLAIGRKLLRGVIDTTIADMVFTAATLPAILAERVQLLRIDKNRIEMEDVSSTWPAIFASGVEIHIDRNWVGTQSAANIREWLPATVADDLSSDQNAVTGTTATTNQNPLTSLADTINLTDVNVIGMNDLITHPGGIQIGGQSRDVYILENEIQGGSRNGITLGSFEILDANGDDTGQWVGVVVTGEGDDCCTGTLQTSGSTPGTPGGRVVSGGRLINIQIHRNRIRNMGLCGIGPVGFFNLLETLEIITIEGLNISQNAISNTLMRPLADIAAAQSTILGYGAICVPDVQNLIIRDNAITNTGADAGASVCGIFILNGEMLEISGNQVLESRDWGETSDANTKSSGARGGIVVLLATPPSFSSPAASSVWSVGIDQAPAGGIDSLATPIYEPGLPALRVEGNVVRIPLGFALFAIGIGPFSVVNNHLTCGGTLRGTGRQLAQTVLIMNLGTAIEQVNAAATPSTIYGNASGTNTGYSTGGSVGLANVSSGAVLFTNNICQLEARASEQREDASIFIYTPDHLIFSNNHCWLDSGRLSAIADALLFAGSLNVIGNRFQEAPSSVLLSAWTAGVLNITSENISTFCLLATGTLLVNSNNLAVVQLFSPDICSELGHLSGIGAKH